MTVLELLQKGKELIKDEKHWCKGTYYTQKDGVDQYCSLGSLRALVAHRFDLIFDKAMMLLSKNMSGGVADFNDTHTHQEVLEAWDRAIHQAQEEEKQ